MSYLSDVVSHACFADQVVMLWNKIYAGSTVPGLYRCDRSLIEKPGRPPACSAPSRNSGGCSVTTRCSSGAARNCPLARSPQGAARAATAATGPIVIGASQRELREHVPVARALALLLSPSRLRVVVRGRRHSPLAQLETLLQFAVACGQQALDLRLLDERDLPALLTHEWVS